MTNIFVVVENINFETKTADYIVQKLRHITLPSTQS